MTAMLVPAAFVVGTFAGFTVGIVLGASARRRLVDAANAERRRRVKAEQDRNDANRLAVAADEARAIAESVAFGTDA